VVFLLYLWRQLRIDLGAILAAEDPLVPAASGTSIACWV
jgi:hypothetical protein